MNTNTKHNQDCARVFSHYDTNCPRCKELIAGSKPRDGWQKRYYAQKSEQAHVPHRCNEIVCTHGEW